MQSKFEFKKTTVSHKTKACPVSYEQVDKHLIKAYSSVVLLILLFTLITGNHVLMYFITIDFIIRVFAGIKYSLLCNLLTTSMKITSLKPVLVNAGAKKIAAQIGLFFCIFICGFHLAGWASAAKLFTLLFSTAIAIDLIFDYCLACKLQSLYLSYLKK